MSTSHFTLRLIHITAIFVNVVWFASRNTFPSGNNCVTLRSGSGSIEGQALHCFAPSHSPRLRIVIVVYVLHIT